MSGYIENEFTYKCGTQEWLNAFLTERGITYETGPRGGSDQYGVRYVIVNTSNRLGKPDGKIDIPRYQIDLMDHIGKHKHLVFEDEPAAYIAEVDAIEHICACSMWSAVAFHRERPK
jgi:hypothetical protein